MGLASPNHVLEPTSNSDTPAHSRRRHGRQPFFKATGDIRGRALARHVDHWRRRSKLRPAGRATGRKSREESRGAKKGRRYGARKWALGRTVMGTRTIKRIRFALARPLASNINVRMKARSESHTRARISRLRPDNPNPRDAIIRRIPVLHARPAPSAPPADTASSMAITFKSSADIEKLRISGRMAAEVLAMIGEHVRPGVTTEELDVICNRFIVNELKAIPAMSATWDSRRPSARR